VRFKIPCSIQHGTRFQIGLCHFGRNKVRAHPFTQVARFADVNHAVEPVAHQVHTRLVWHLMHFLLQIGFLFLRGSHASANLPEKNVLGNLASGSDIAFHCNHGLVGRLAGRARHFVRADLLEPTRRAEDCPPYQFSRPQAGGYRDETAKKAPARFWQALLSFSWKTTGPLWPCCGRSSCFLVSNHTGRLG